MTPTSPLARVYFHLVPAAVLFPPEPDAPGVSVPRTPPTSPALTASALLHADLV